MSLLKVFLTPSNLQMSKVSPSRRMVGLWNLLTFLFDASPNPEKGVCHLQDLAKTSVTVGALPFGQIWFQSKIRVRTTGVLKDQATRKHLPSSRTL